MERHWSSLQPCPGFGRPLPSFLLTLHHICIGQANQGPLKSITMGQSSQIPLLLLCSLDRVLKGGNSSWLPDLQWTSPSRVKGICCCLSPLDLVPSLPGQKMSSNLGGYLPCSIRHYSSCLCGGTCIAPEHLISLLSAFYRHALQRMDLDVG